MKTTTAFMEIRDDESWDLTFSDLDQVIENVGLDVMTSFLRAYVHSDRIFSLVTMFHLSRSDAPESSPGEFRNFAAFQAFMIGSLRELAETLKDLRTHLLSRGLFSDRSWQDGLLRWEEWGRGHKVNTIRKKYAFHVDHDLIREGLSSVPRSATGSAVALRGSSGKSRHSQFFLGEAAAIEGIRKRQGSLDILGEPSEYLDITTPLESEFFRVLAAADVRIIPVRHRGGVR